MKNMCHHITVNAEHVQKTCTHKMRTRECGNGTYTHALVRIPKSQQQQRFERYEVEARERTREKESKRHNLFFRLSNHFPIGTWKMSF